MMKICYVLTISGTVTVFFARQLKYLAEQGYDVSVICSPDQSLQDRLGEKVRYIPTEIPRGISFTGSIKAIDSLVRIFKKEKFDLIQYSTPNAAFYASIASRIAGCKVRNYHLMGFRYAGTTGKGRFILKTIEKITCNNSTSIECVSPSNMNFGIREGLFPPDKVTVVWHGSTGGVDTARFSYEKRDIWRNEVRKETGCNESDFVYGFVGRITRDKGINELLTAFMKLKTDSKLLLVGQMDELDTLNPKIFERAKENPNIIIHNGVYDIERYYAAMDVLVLPSYREGFGNVVIEAAAVGTPAIVSDIPGPTDAISTDTAITVPPRDAKALYQAMKTIRKMDYIQMGKNAAAFAKENFDSDVLCEKIYERKQFLLGNS